MESIVKQIYSGEIGTYEKIIELSEDRKLTRRALELEEEFYEKLNSFPELQEFFQKLVKAKENANIANYENFYANGVRIGILLGTDANRILTK